MAIKLHLDHWIKVFNSFVVFGFVFLFVYMCKWSFITPLNRKCCMTFIAYWTPFATCVIQYCHAACSAGASVFHVNCLSFNAFAGEKLTSQKSNNGSQSMCYQPYSVPVDHLDNNQILLFTVVFHPLHSYFVILHN